MKIELLDPASLIPADYNPRSISDHQMTALKKSLERFGFVQPVVINERTGSIVGGHQRTVAAQALGLEKVPVVRVDLEEQNEQALNIALNKIGGEFQEDQLAEILRDLGSDGWNFRELGFDDDELHALIEATAPSPDLLSESLGEDPPAFPEPTPEQIVQRKSLAEQFGIVPFSVLNARAGQWQERKRAWLSLGIESEVGRGTNLLKMSDTMLEPDPEKRAALGAVYSNPEMIPGYYEKIKAGMTKDQIVAEHQASGSSMSNGTSIFDPVLCELAYRWFSAEGSVVLDPFAGGSVRGVVASKLNRNYVGVELRSEQVEANRKQADLICDEAKPEWIEGDSRLIPKLCKDVKADFVFSCPPYADLEVYSDDERDLSTLDYDEFVKAYRKIIKVACQRLKPNRFACFIVGDVRDKSGAYRNFVGDTVEAFRAAGLEYYNEAILVTAAGTLPLRAGRAFAASRKLGKTHQNVLVFVKGDGKQAAADLGECQYGAFDGNLERADSNGLRPPGFTQDSSASAEVETPEGEATEFGTKLTASSLGGEI